MYYVVVECVVTLLRHFCHGYHSLHTNIESMLYRMQLHALDNFKPVFFSVGLTSAE